MQDRIKVKAMASNPIKAGSEIKHHCSRCDLELWHTVVAVVGNRPARVRCNTCKTERNYKAPKLEDSKPREPRRMERPRPSGSHPDFYQEKLRQSVMKSVQPYRIDSVFVEGDVLDHVKFGRGVVLKLIHPDRMDVIFQDEVRTLIRKS